MAVFSVNNNLAAFQSVRALERINQRQAQSSERLSSGLRINRAADDAAGLAISGLMKSQILGTTVAERNAQDGISLLQVGEGGLDTIGGMLRRIRNLALQSANDTLTDTDRGHIQKEVDHLLSEIDRQAGSVNFNTKKLLTGDYNQEASSTTTTTIIPAGAPSTTTFDSNGVTAASNRPNYYDLPTVVNPNLVSPEPSPPGLTEFLNANYTEASAVGGGNFTATTNVAGNREAMRFQYQFSGTASQITNISFRFVGGSRVDGVADTAVMQLYDFNAGSWVTVANNNGTFAAFADVTGSNSTTPSRFVDTDGDIWAQVYSQTATTGGANLSELAIDYTSLAVTTQTPGSTTTTTTNTTAKSLKFQVGANRNESLEAFLPSTTAGALGISGLSVSTRVRAESAIAVVSSALDRVDGNKARVGAQINRAQSSFVNNANKKENETAARSRIADADYATELVQFTKDQILAQTATSAIAQANLIPQAILQLLR